ncbi:hypothetical protein IWZ01DRAFT_513322 [Phyllosticta capitalensis]
MLPVAILLRALFAKSLTAPPTAPTAQHLAGPVSISQPQDAPLGEWNDAVRKTYVEAAKRLIDQKFPIDRRPYIGDGASMQLAKSKASKFFRGFLQPSKFPVPGFLNRDSTSAFNNVFWDVFDWLREKKYFELTVAGQAISQAPTPPAGASAAQLGGDIEALESEKAALGTAVDKLKVEKNGVGAEVEGLEERKSSLQGEVEGLEDKKRALEGELKGLQEQKRGFEGELEGLQEKKRGLDSEIAELNFAKANTTKTTPPVMNNGVNGQLPLASSQLPRMTGPGTQPGIPEESSSAPLVDDEFENISAEIDSLDFDNFMTFQPHEELDESRAEQLRANFNTFGQLQDNQLYDRTAENFHGNFNTFGQHQPLDNSPFHEALCRRLQQSTGPPRPKCSADGHQFDRGQLWTARRSAAQPLWHTRHDSAKAPGATSRFSKAPR